MAVVGIGKNKFYKSRDRKVAKQPVKRTKHIPQRTCIGCRQVMAKKALIRVVRTSDGVQIDPTGKLAGRGAYIHQDRSCWDRALKGALAHALKIELTDQDRAVLIQFAQSMPDDNHVA
jgi:predicted RNA-binding protein YlxR (DUF448 family)